MTETAAPSPGHSVKVATEYVVLSRVGITDEVPPEKGWREVGTFDARTGEQAIKQYVERTKADGVFVAIPARSWTPVKVAVKTETRLEVSAA